MRAGMTPPRITFRDVPGQVQAQIVADPLASPLLEAFQKLAAAIAEAAIATALTARPPPPTPIASQPAFTRLHEFLDDDVPARRAARRSASPRCRTAPRCTPTTSAGTRRPT